jgi:hypothetical protein
MLDVMISNIISFSKIKKKEKTMRYCWVWVLVSIFSVIHGCNENGAKTDEPDGSD